MLDVLVECLKNCWVVPTNHCTRVQLHFLLVAAVRAHASQYLLNCFGTVSSNRCWGLQYRQVTLNFMVYNDYMFSDQ